MFLCLPAISIVLVPPHTSPSLIGLVGAMEVVHRYWSTFVVRDQPRPDNMSVDSLQDADSTVVGVRIVVCRWRVCLLAQCGSNPQGPERHAQYVTLPEVCGRHSYHRLGMCCFQYSSDPLYVDMHRWHTDVPLGAWLTRAFRSSARASLWAAGTCDVVFRNRLGAGRLGRAPCARLPSTFALSHGEAHPHEGCEG